MKSRTKILVVEDDENDFVFLTRIMTAVVNVDIHHVEDGYKAIQFLSCEGPYGERTGMPLPDIIFLDLKLPKIRGEKVLEWIRSDSRFGATKVYVLTSSHLERDNVKHSNAGAQGYFVKPLSLGHIAVVFG